MVQPAAAAAACLIENRATACTDVTGFGLLGHLFEMLRASGVSAAIDPDAVPALDGALSLLGRGITSSLHADNLAAMSALDPDGRGGDDPVIALLLDPQTAGGLLAGLPAERAERCVSRLGEFGYRAAVIGRVEVPRGNDPRIRLLEGAAENVHETIMVSSR
jgi:selenide,water dikinase